MAQLLEYAPVIYWAAAGAKHPIEAIRAFFLEEGTVLPQNCWSHLYADGSGLSWAVLLFNSLNKYFSWPNTYYVLDQSFHGRFIVYFWLVAQQYSFIKDWYDLYKLSLSSQTLIFHLWGKQKALDSNDFISGTGYPSIYFADFVFPL